MYVVIEDKDFGDKLNGLYEGIYQVINVVGELCDVLRFCCDSWDEIYWYYYYCYGQIGILQKFKVIRQFEIFCGVRVFFDNFSDCSLYQIVDSIEVFQGYIVRFDNVFDYWLCQGWY